MPITVTITKVLDDFWISKEQAKEVSDSFIVDMCKDDLYEFSDGACWTVERS